MLTKIMWMAKICNHGVCTFYYKRNFKNNPNKCARLRARVNCRERETGSGRKDEEIGSHMFKIFTLTNRLLLIPKITCTARCSLKTLENSLITSKIKNIC